MNHQQKHGEAPRYPDTTDRRCGECGSQRYSAERVYFHITDSEDFEYIMEVSNDKNGIIVNCADCGVELNRVKIK